MGRRKRETVTVEIDVARVVRRLSRKEFGRPGQGRKTAFGDRKREASRRACRKKEEEE